ncbi:MAG: hypothetical protein MNPFHGCM_03234 [Gemmatimonadaceae bacterium]|nr:hypothetical protein [Gemmatimonadaceae bacterium]
MARLPRFSALEHPQHVIQRGNNRTRLFDQAQDYLVFRRCMQSALQRCECDIHAYVLMTNHVHLLITSNAAGAIGKFMQSVGRSYVRYFNDRYRRTGTLWEGRYRATLISTDEYLFRCSRYIEENPVRAGMVSNPAGYRWSSYSANALGMADALVTPHARYLALGASPHSRQRAYRALFRNVIDKAGLHAIRDATNHAWALGGERFQIEVASRDRRAARQPRGRRPAVLQTGRVGSADY